MISFLTSGISLGFAAGSIPGAGHAFLVTETLRGGIRQSIVILATPFLADLPLIIASVLLLPTLPNAFLQGLQIIGGSYLIWLGRGAWHSADETLSLDRPTSGRGSVFRRAMLVNWLNPNPYIFWTTVTGPILIDALEVSIWHGLGFVAAFYITFMLMMLAVVVVFNRVRGAGQTLLRRTIRLSAILLMLFGGLLLLRGLAG